MVNILGNSISVVGDCTRDILQTKLKGHIFTWMEDDTLFIYLDNKIKCTHMITNISKRIEAGDTSVEFAEEFVKAYKTLINYSFFRKDGSEDEY